MDETALLRRILRPRADAFASLAAFRDAWEAEASGVEPPIDRAILGGALADRLGYAFAASYSCALARLVPGSASACLCVTEEGGGHPKAIRTALRPDGQGYRLDGAKRWATLAGQQDVLLVVATVGVEGDRNLLRLVRVRSDAPGVTIAPLPETPFTPEIPHYAVTLDGVLVASEDVLPGDGYATYVKPFRTVEDAHVSAAAAAHLLRIARASGWPEVLPTRLIALLLAMRATAGLPPEEPTTHVAIEGCLAALRAVVEAAEPYWSSAEPELAARWHRDAPILSVASSVRAARLAGAWRALG